MIAEYVVNGETFRLEAPTPAKAELLKRSGQRSTAHSLNRNLIGVYGEFGEMLAILLDIPIEKALGLPIHMLIDVHRDLEDAVERMGVPGTGNA